MQTFMVITENSEHIQALEAFLKALKIKYKTEPTLEALEARLSKDQMKIWDGLKISLQEIKSGDAEGTTWENFKKELANENSFAPAI